MKPGSKTLPLVTTMEGVDDVVEGADEARKQDLACGVVCA